MPDQPSAAELEALRAVATAARVLRETATKEDFWRFEMERLKKEIAEFKPASPKRRGAGPQVDESKRFQGMHDDLDIAVQKYNTAAGELDEAWDGLDAALAKLKEMGLS